MFKKKEIILVSVLLVFAGLIFSFSKEKGGQMIRQSAFLEKSGKVLNLEIAETSASLEKGLSDRTSLASNAGLLFVFPKADLLGFWMKDMHFPIDIIWMDENFVITEIKKNALPESYPEVFYPSLPSLYVLEVNSGVSDQYGFSVGSTLDIHR